MKHKESNTSRHPWLTNVRPQRIKNKRQLPVQRTTTAWRLRAQSRPSTQIAKVFVGKAFVSIHFRPVSTPSLCSVGHSPKVHGTQAQYKLATSPCLNVVQNCPAKAKNMAQNNYASCVVRYERKKNEE